MIPLRDTITSKNYPVVNNTIIGINIVVFLVQLFQGQNTHNFSYLYGLVPARYSIPHVSSNFTAIEQLFPFISFMFLHGSFWHILGNMWTLYIFGDNVEDSMGPFRYLVFYIACGLVSGLTHLFLNFHSNFPTIGASGAIAGVMGAYFILYPNAKILTLIPIIIIPWIIEIPAFFFLIFWFLLQILNAAGSSGQAGGIAWWAHIGGFLCGIIWIKMSSLVPQTGLTGITRNLTGKKRSNRLQVIRPASTGNDNNLYGILKITPYEAAMGTQKIVSISQGFNKKLYKVVVPPRVSDGSILRLKGFRHQAENGFKIDLFLKMVIEE